jgi:hypothetical protein
MAFTTVWDIISSLRRKIPCYIEFSGAVSIHSPFAAISRLGNPAKPAINWHKPWKAFPVPRSKDAVLC